MRIWYNTRANLVEVRGLFTREPDPTTTDKYIDTYREDADVTLRIEDSRGNVVVADFTAPNVSGSTKGNYAATEAGVLDESDSHRVKGTATFSDDTPDVDIDEPLTVARA